jgi:ABC-type transporter Mla subunit MlaD
MVLQQPTAGHVAEDLFRVLLLVIALVAVIAVAIALFGVAQAGPSYDLTIDPAHVSGLPF